MDSPLAYGFCTIFYTHNGIFRTLPSYMDLLNTCILSYMESTIRPLQYYSTFTSLQLTFLCTILYTTFVIYDLTK